MTGTALSIVIPAFNEEHRIGALLQALQPVAQSAAAGGAVEVIVVCDGCSDRTETIARTSADLPNLRVVAYSPNRGKGHAVRTGVSHSRGAVVAFMDADGSTPAVEVERLAAPIAAGHADVVIGSRRAAGAHVVTAQPWYRRFLGLAFAAVTRRLLGLPYLDTQCGFKLFRGDLAHELFRTTDCPGFGFDMEILLAARRRGLRVLEMGVSWRDIPGSKVSPIADGWRMLRTAWSLRGRADRQSGDTTRRCETDLRSTSHRSRREARPEETPRHA